MSNLEELNSSVDCIRSWEQVRPWEDSWNASAGSNFMLRTEWLESWWDAYRQGSDRLAIGKFTRSRNLESGILTGFVTRGILGRTFRWLGSGIACSDDMRLLGAAAEQGTHGALAARWLNGERFRSEFGRLDTIELEGYHEQEQSVRELIRNLQSLGWSLEERSIGGAWRIELPSTLEEYVSQLHKSRRRKVNKAKRLLADGTVRYEAIFDWSQMDQLWSEFVRLHQKRRQSLGQSGCFSDPRFGIFLRQAAERMTQKQSCWMGSLWAGDEPIGLNLSFRSGDTLALYQTGMEMDRTDLEPGHLLNYYSIGTAIEQGLKWFDFLRGDELYKEGWGAQRRVLYRSRLFAPHLLARVRQSALAAGRELRNWSAGWFGGLGNTVPQASAETAAE